MTHLDALCHASYQGKWYNGFVLAQGFSDQAGCAKLGTEAVKQGIVTRGILVDMTRLKIRRVRQGRALTSRTSKRGSGRPA